MQMFCGWGEKSTKKTYIFTRVYPPSSGMQHIPYNLLAIWDQSNGLATILQGQCGLDKIIALDIFKDV